MTDKFEKRGDEFGVMVKCHRASCGYTTWAPVGHAHPEQLICSHNFKESNYADLFECECGVRISGEAAAIMRWSTDAGMRTKLEKALGEIQKLRDENTQLLAENARMRRKGYAP